MSRSQHLYTAHALWKELILPSDTLIDATSGNGHDTLFLSKQLTSGQIYAIDIQQQALDNTHAKIISACKIHYICASHATFPSEIKPETVRLIVYNLGYLPGGDKSLTTMTNSTLTSLKNALPLLVPGGALSITLYPGHEEGASEAEAILSLANTLPYHVMHHTWGDNPKSPSLLWIQKS